MNWQEIMDSVTSDLIVAAVVGLTTGTLAFFGGKKKGESISVKAVERKNIIYQPLLEELEKQAYCEWGIIEKITSPRLDDCVINSYKYAFDEDLQMGMGRLYDLHNQFNEISTLGVAHKVSVDIFEKGYTALYGSIIEAIVPQETPDGDEYYEEILADPVLSIRSYYDEKSYKRLLEREGETDDIVVLQIGNSDEDEYADIYSDLKNMYDAALNTISYGVKYELPKQIIDTNLNPAEYMAYKYDFFKLFNAEEKIIKKYELKEEITLLSQVIVQQLKERIEKIVKTYEVEQIG